MKLNHPESIRGQCLRNLSSPVGEVSMMVFLQSAWSSVSYVPIDHLYSLVISTGKEALLIKADIKLIKGVYRMLSIHSEDQALLGVCWEGTSSHTDRALPFNIIAAVVEALQWIVVNKGVRNLIYYLDVFIFVSESLEEASLPISRFW